MKAGLFTREDAMIPDFKDGEEVEFEVNSDGTPRWNITSDLSRNLTSPPTYVKCKVRSSRNDRFITAYVFGTISKGWIWPQPSDKDRLKCFSYDGYVRRVGASPFVSVTAANNDGRKTCYACGAATKTVMGFSNSYQICTKCGK